jgi:hypothetical protein
LWAEPRNVLPSKAITSADTPISLATQATKRRWNCVASSVAKMSPGGRAMASHPQTAGTGAAVDLLLAEPRYVDEGFRPGKHGEQAQQQDLI